MDAFPLRLVDVRKRRVVMARQGQAVGLAIRDDARPVGLGARAADLLALPHHVGKFALRLPGLP